MVVKKSRASAPLETAVGSTVAPGAVVQSAGQLAAVSGPVQDPSPHRPGPRVEAGCGGDVGTGVASTGDGVAVGTQATSSEKRSKQNGRMWLREWFIFWVSFELVDRYRFDYNLNYC
jgi:hypothetical protein